MRKCPVCALEFPNFMPIAESYVRHHHRIAVPYSLEDFETLNLGQYTCPHCDAPDRDRLVALYVRDHLRWPAGELLRVLDIAPGKALARWLRALPDVDYRSGDLDPELADEEVDICDMPQFEDGSFDLIVCSHVLEHVVDDRRAMRELHRVLSHRGRAILMVPILTTATSTDEDVTLTDPNERWLRFGQGDHVRMYCKSDWLERLSEAGWTVQPWDASAFGATMFREHGIAERSVLYVGSRRAA